MSHLLLFNLSDLHCALPLTEIERILRVVEISPIPRAPEVVMGLVNVQGRIIPVLDLRKLFHLSASEISLNDQLIIARSTNGSVALLVDNVIGVGEYGEEDITSSDALFPGIECLDGVAKLKDGIIYIYHLDRLFSAEHAAEIAPLIAANTLETNGMAR